MEPLAISPVITPVVSLFARHRETNELPPQRQIAEVLQQGSFAAALENLSQIILALLDQHYYSSVTLLTSTHRRVPRHRSLVKPSNPVNETSCQGFFGHLFIYCAATTHTCSTKPSPQSLEINVQKRPDPAREARSSSKKYYSGAALTAPAWGVRQTGPGRQRRKGQRSIISSPR